MGKEQYSEERLKKLSYTKFVRLLGVGRVVFYEMVKVVEKVLDKKYLNKKGRMGMFLKIICYILL